jgi:hypothetical protein
MVNGALDDPGSGWGVDRHGEQLDHVACHCRGVNVDRARLRGAEQGDRNRLPVLWSRSMMKRGALQLLSVISTCHPDDTARLGWGDRRVAIGDGLNLYEASICPHRFGVARPRMRRLPALRTRAIVPPSGSMRPFRSRAWSSPPVRTRRHGAEILRMDSLHTSLKEPTLEGQV